MINRVELLGYYGSDLTHAQSAWTSTSRDLTPEKLDRIPKLLNMLASEGHETPFEKSSFHFLVTVDQATHIHLLKHRIGVSINGESARYKELKEDKAYTPSDWTEEWQKRLEIFTETGNGLYHRALEELTPVLGRKRAKESARFYLPYGNQITADISFNFRSFMHFQELRNSEHAQLEIRQIAQKMLDIVRATGRFNESLKAFGY